MNIVLRVSNLSKIYRLGEIGTGTISRDLERWFRMRIIGQEDPFLKIGETNVRNTKGMSDVVYSLQDINFEVEQGDALGIIGKNGAGKSTLLKIISRVTSPTTGKINIKGRVASLLEVGTGFHQELTGRENIYLNGAILGMRKKEIDRKLDEIIDFSGVERYIDTPVKRFSSGMFVRLAFAVAAHLESEILIVDEVLAVGDAEFQKKCIGKMGDVSRGEGRTVLFVSHNMAAVQNLCKRGIVLNNGFAEFNGEIMESIEHYLTSRNDRNIPISQRTDRRGKGNLKLIDVRIGDNSNKLQSGTETVLLLKFANSLKNKTSRYTFNINIKNKIGDVITYLSTDFSTNRILLTPSFQEIRFRIFKLNLTPGHYNMRIYIEVNHEIEDWIDDACNFEIIDSDIFKTGMVFMKGYGDFYLDFAIESST